MKVLGIDPGTQTGWVHYDGAEHRVLAHGQVVEHMVPLCGPEFDQCIAVVERPKGYGPTRPQLVDCGYVAGRIVQKLIGARIETVEMTRLEVCKALSESSHGEVRVRNDATAWAALLLLHGGEQSAKKGGPLHGVRAHERAALAVAVAWWLTHGGDNAK